MQVQADPVFDRDLFLLRQQLLKISEKYDVGDEQGKNITYIERPAQILTGLANPFIDNVSHLGGLAGGTLAALAVRPRLLSAAPPT